MLTDAVPDLDVSCVDVALTAAVPTVAGVKNLSVISDNLGSRRHPAGIARYKLGENIFQDASDQVVDCLGCVLGED